MLKNVPGFQESCTRKALRQKKAILDYIVERNIDATEKIDSKLIEAAEELEKFPECDLY